MKTLGTTTLGTTVCEVLREELKDFGEVGQDGKLVPVVDAQGRPHAGNPRPPQLVFKVDGLVVPVAEFAAVVAALKP